MFGLTAPLRDGTGPAGMATKTAVFMTNSTGIEQAFAKNCYKPHARVALMDGRAKNAEVCPEPLCEAVRRG